MGSSCDERCTSQSFSNASWIDFFNKVPNLSCPDKQRECSYTKLFQKNVRFKICDFHSIFTIDLVCIIRKVIFNMEKVAHTIFSKKKILYVCMYVCVFRWLLRFPPPVTTGWSQLKSEIPNFKFRLGVSRALRWVLW